MFNYSVQYVIVYILIFVNRVQSKIDLLNFENLEIKILI